MAEAPGHRLGQIIGDALELALKPVLTDFVREHDLYLDSHGPRPARNGSKVTWRDLNGNTHDLDFVIERGGTDHKIGVPVAFIEAAWRRYTKHSRNKAQEIQGAIEPLLKTHASVKPFGGAIVGGMWTSGALTQLTSLGFAVAHLSYADVVEAFRSVGVDVNTTESTTDHDLHAQVQAYDMLSGADRDKLGEALRQCAPEEFARFRKSLEAAIVRKIARVTVLALHGESLEYETAEEAVASILHYSAPDHMPRFCRWEIQIRFTNGDRIEATFQAGNDAVDFLRSFS